MSFISRSDVESSEVLTKNNPSYQHEGLDRTHMLICQLQSAFGNPDDIEDLHPSICNKRCRHLLHKVTESLADLYQAIGEIEFPDSKTN